MDKANNVTWKVVMALCILLFGVFALLYMLQNRRNVPQLALESQDSDSQNLANDWKNIFNDLNISFNKMTSN
jgi:alpha-glucuronidase